MKLAVKIGIAVALVAAPALAVPTLDGVMQDRSPAYAAARAQGLVGEQPDGYLGIVGTPTAELRGIVNDINIRRKAAYTRSAASDGSTVEQFAFVSGCNLILRTQPGEKYQAPDGSWRTRDSSPPVRDPRCV